MKGVKLGSGGLDLNFLFSYYVLSSFESSGHFNFFLLCSSCGKSTKLSDTPVISPVNPFANSQAGSVF